MRLMCSLYRKKYRNFKLARATNRSGLRRSEVDWKKQINWSCSTHIYENNIRKLPFSCLYLELAKCHISHFICYVFSSTKLENRRVEQVFSGRWVGMSWHRWEVGGGGVGESGTRMNKVQRMYTHVQKCKK
jgi:hypothetical protein